MVLWRCAHSRRNLAWCLLLLFSCSPSLSCSPSGERLSGVVTHDGAPVAGATVSVYLDRGDRGEGTPFITGKTGRDGRFDLVTGGGRFYVVARKVEYENERERVLRGRAENEPVSPGGTREIVIVLRSLEESRFSPDADTYVTGVVNNPFGDEDGTYLFAYDSERDISTGPTFLTKTQVDGEGKFSLPLKEGSFLLVAMKKGSGSEVGPLTAGGLRAEYGGNPIVIKKGDTRWIGTLVLKRPDPEKMEDTSKKGGLTGSEYVVRGKVVLEDGGPAPHLFVMAYGDGNMIGRPDSISEETGDEGSFTLYLPGPGKYYLGARESIGGPLSPGELTGTYEGRADHSVVLTADKKTEVLQIVVREKW